MTTHLFILASHNTGSTALWHILKTSPAATWLPVEGQHIEEVRGVMRTSPWNPKHEVPWPQVKAAWEAYWEDDKEIRIEKSPPNLLRAAAIEAHFENAYFIVMVRDPYAYCEGVRRRGRKGIGYSVTAGCAEIAQGWIEEARIQKENLRELKHALYISYEDFTDDTAGTVEKILDFLPGLGRLNSEASFLTHSLHGNVRRPPTNLNLNQIARLSQADIDEINGVLTRYPELLETFHYKIRRRTPGFVASIRLALDNFVQRTITRNLQRLLGRFKRGHRTS